MQPQALTRVDGAVLGVRQIDYPARPARRDDQGRETSPASPASTVYEVDVATTYSRYDGSLVANLTSVLPVTYGADETRPTAGEVVSLLVYPYPSVTRTKSGSWLRRAAHRFVAPVPAPAASGAARAA